jgi:predicted PurR-regulated permease PerM
MALFQFGSVTAFLVVAATLSTVHFFLTNVIQTVLLGRSLNLSPLAIILSLTFWGLVWGVAGLFLAVPITAAITIVCEHIDGVRWVAVVLADPRRRYRRTRASTALSGRISKTT